MHYLIFEQMIPIGQVESPPHMIAFALALFVTINFLTVDGYDPGPYNRVIFGLSTQRFCKLFFLRRLNIDKEKIGGIRWIGLYVRCIQIPFDQKNRKKDCQ